MNRQVNDVLHATLPVHDELVRRCESDISVGGVSIEELWQKHGEWFADKLSQAIGLMMARESSLLCDEADTKLLTEFIDDFPNEEV